MKILKKITSVFLAAVFLLSSFGFTMSSMVCIKSGKGKVSFALIEDCCAKKKVETPVAKADCCDEEMGIPYPEEIAVIKKGHCCDISSITFSLNDYQNAKKLSVDQPAVFNSLFHSSETLAYTSADKKLSFQYSDLPPPLYGRNLLTFISVLTI